MAFLEDPRLRQRWNRIAHDAEAVTENAAASIFTFSQNYINPCFSSIVDSIEQCTTVCLGDPEDRLRRKRERQRARDHAEFSFDFYDDWYQEEQTGGLLGHWGVEDWDRLLAGTGAARKHGGAETTEQPRRKRGMSYGTRGGRRKPSAGEDPTIIPSTQPIGFLSRLPWKMGGTLRYKPSAADLQDHPGKHDEREAMPLLGGDGDELDDESDYGQAVRTTPRQRSGTTGSEGTSDSYRSRGDLFPSDGEGEEDAIPLDDDVTYDMIKRDDRSSGRTRSSAGKRPVGQFAASRTVSRSTLASSASADSPAHERMAYSHPSTSAMTQIPSTDNVPSRASRNDRQEEQDDQQEAMRGVSEQHHPSQRTEADDNSNSPAEEAPGTKSNPGIEVQADDIYPRPPNAPRQEEKEEALRLSSPRQDDGVQQTSTESQNTEAPGGLSGESNGARRTGLEKTSPSSSTGPSFHAARLPHFT